MNEIYFVEYYHNSYGKLRSWFSDRQLAVNFFNSKKDSVLLTQDSKGFDRVIRIKATKSKIKRIYHHYLDWEDYQNGMYRDVDKSKHEKYVKLASELLSNRKALYYAMRRASMDWVKATEFNLTNIACNRRAWLGWAACCIQYNVPEYLTRQSWHTLSPELQKDANDIADIVIDEWEQHFLTLKTEPCQK